MHWIYLSIHETKLTIRDLEFDQMIPFTDTYSLFYSIFTALGEGEKTTRFVFSYYFYRLKFRENLVIQNLKLNFFFLISNNYIPVIYKYYYR